MMKRITISVLVAMLSLGTGLAQTNNLSDRALWASINGADNASLGDYKQHTGKVLVTWRMLPGDDATTGFDLYRTIGTGTETKIATSTSIAPLARVQRRRSPRISQTELATKTGQPVKPPIIFTD